MNNITNNIQDQIPQSLNFGEILKSLKKILWVFILLLIGFNIALYYFLFSWIYFVSLIIGNVVFVWVCIPIMIWIGKSVLVDRGMEAVDEVKQKFSGGGSEQEKFSKEKVVKVVKKKD